MTQEIKNLIRVADTDIIGQKSILHGLTKIKGVGLSFSNAICETLNINKTDKIGAIDEKTKEQGLIIGFSETMAMKTECSNKKGTQLPSGKLLGECAWLTSPPSPVVSASATTTASAEVEQKIGFNSKVLTEISGLNRLKATDLPRAIGLFVQWAMGMLGSIALVLLIYAGVLWMTAAGNAERTKKSQDIMDRIDLASGNF